jgi:hypothetical protein
MTISDVSQSRSRRVSETRPRTSRAPAAFFANTGPVLFALAVTAVLIVGWTQRDEGHLTPERGLGYWLGIWGGTAMLLLLLYPLRKRLQLMRFFGSVPSWFRIHMVLGIVGPVLILFHANFKLGSANSNVALFSMLLVAGSGVIGRYLYGKIHLGLYGRKANVADLIADVDTLKEDLGHDLPLTDHIVEALNAFSTDALKPASGVISGSFGLLTLGWKAGRVRTQLLGDARTILAREASAHGWSRATRRRHLKSVRAHLNQFFVAVRRAAAFAVYERLFALWHVLHLPLFFLLILTAVLHVIAVHTF